MNDHDTTWLDALAGRTNGEQSPAITQEALALRKLIREHESGNAGAPVAEVDAAREKELIARAAAQGLLAPPSARAPSASASSVRAPAARRRQSTGLRFTLAAAAVLVIAVGVGLLRSPQPPMERFRGAQNGTVRLAARDPLALKRKLIEELSGAGVSVSGYERLGHIGIDADLPQPLPPSIRQILDRHHIPAPPDGALVVEIDPSDP
jgi:hypothetical protein